MTHFRSVAGWLFVRVIFSPAAAPAAEDWQALWDKTVAAAKQEGQVVVCISPGVARREFLLKQWKADYPEIELSVQNVSGTSFVPGVAIERSAGRYLWDVFDSGPNTGYSAIKAGLLDPLLPELILPEVNDPAVWGGWDDAFYDDEKKYVLGLVTDLETPYYNAALLAPEKVAAEGLKALLDPELKGKIVWYDPRREGPGSPYLALFDHVLGADNLRKLLTDQDPTFVTAMNDAGEAIARGKAIVAISGSPRLDLAPYLAAGVAIDARNFGNTPETVYRGTDGTTLGVFNQAPHPNAARLFINWIMTKRVSELMEQSQGWSSRRSDVPPVDPNEAPIPGATYFYAQRPENDAVMRRWMAELKQLRPQ